MFTEKPMKENDYFYYTDEIPDKDLSCNTLILRDDNELTTDDVPINSVREN